MKIIMTLGFIFLSLNTYAVTWNCETASEAKSIEIQGKGQPMENGYSLHYISETLNGKCSQFVAIDEASKLPTAFKGYLYQVCDNSITGLGSFEAINCWQ